MIYFRTFILLQSVTCWNHCFTTHYLQYDYFEFYVKYDQNHSKMVKNDDFYHFWHQIMMITIRKPTQTHQKQVKNGHFGHILPTMPRHYVKTRSKMVNFDHFQAYPWLHCRFGCFGVISECVSMKFWQYPMTIFILLFFTYFCINFRVL